MVEAQARDEHDRLHNTISELMDEAASKTRQEVETLRKLYNANLEKLIEECNCLETVGIYFFILILISKFLGKKQSWCPS